jgi:4-alpha-glucanotransferase
MYFERVDGPGFRPAREYEELALTVADTHDQVPVAGFWAGRDVDIREEAGLLTAEGAAQARLEREVEREKLTERLRLDGGLDTENPDAHDIVCATHRYLCATPSLMVSVSLEDVAGETEPVNVPGVDHAAYPSWTRRLTTPLEALITDPAAQERLAACTDRRRA